MNNKQDNKKAPLQTLRDGAVSIKLWEQQSENNRFVTASVGKVYKDADGNFKESRAFGETDLLKLQAMIPQARDEIKRWHEFYRKNSQQQAPQQQQNMAAQRDAVMQQSSHASQSHQGHTQGHEHNRNQPPERSR